MVVTRESGSGTRSAFLDLFELQEINGGQKNILLTREELDAFAVDVSEADLGRHVLEEGNYLWHIFSWKLVPCLEGDAAREALAALPAGKVYLFYEGKWNDLPYVKPVELPLAADFFQDLHDVYLVDKEFTWTYVQTHEAACGPYFCRIKK